MALYGGITLPGRPDLANIQRLDLLSDPMRIRMQRYGMGIDPDHFRMVSADLAREMETLKADIACEIPIDRLDEFVGRSGNDADDWSPINVESGKQIGDLIFDCLGVGRARELKKTKGGDRISTGKKQLESLKKEHKVVQLVLDYRERSKLKSTYADALPRQAVLHEKGHCRICELTHKHSTWRVHTKILSTRTGTGRFASKHPNLQNIPARSKLGKLIRAGFIASPGCKLVGRDFSQIELRLLAHCANEPHMIAVYLKDGDIHLETAMRAFKISDPNKVDKNLHRAPCKNVNFGVVYGLQAPGLYDLMCVTYATAGVDMPDWLTVDWCEYFINQWFDLYPDVRRFMDNETYMVYRYGVSWTLLGRIRRIPDVKSALKWIRAGGERQAGNLKVQGTSADLMRLVMGDLEEEYVRALDTIWCWPLMTIHDEVLTEVEEDYAEAMDQIGGEVFDRVMIDRQTGRCLSRVPIKSEGKIMDRWQK